MRPIELTESNMGTSVRPLDSSAEQIAEGNNEVRNTMSNMQDFTSPALIY